MALKCVYTSRPVPGLSPQHKATFIVGEVVGQSPGNSLKVRITHSVNPDFPVGSNRLLCGRRCQRAIVVDGRVFDEATMADVTPEAEPTKGSGETKA